MARPSSATLHRARRARENELRDRCLATADRGCAEALASLAKARVAVNSGHRFEALHLLVDAERTLRSLRLVLRTFFDTLV